jgi:hypothetical protein
MFLLATVFLVISCKMEKRIYMSGFNVERHNSKQHTDKPNVVNNKKTTQQNKIVVKELPIDTTSRVNNPLVITDTDKNVTASVDNKPTLIAHDKPMSFQRRPIIKKENKISETKIGFKKRIKKLITNQQDDYYSKDNDRTSGMAIASFVCSLVGLLLCFTIIAPIVLGTIGIVLGALAMKETLRDKKKGRGLAIAGFTIGILEIVLIIGIFVVLFFPLAP